MIRYESQQQLEREACSSISLNKHQANEWILSSSRCCYHNKDLCFIPPSHLQVASFLNSCSNFMNFFFFFPPSCRLVLLPCLITQSIKKAIKHHAANMCNPLNKSWIKYANRNNGMLIGATLCLTYWFSGITIQTFFSRSGILPTFKADWTMCRYSVKNSMIEARRIPFSED